MAAFTFADYADLQKGFEKPIPVANQSIVDEFLRRASTRLIVKIGPGLQSAWEDSEAESVLRTFVKDMVVDAAERKIRNPGGFSHENAGIFSVSRDEDFAKGRITFDPEDLKELEELLETGRNAVHRGPISTNPPAWQRPGLGYARSRR